MNLSKFFDQKMNEATKTHPRNLESITFYIMANISRYANFTNTNQISLEINTLLLNNLEINTLLFTNHEIKMTQKSSQNVKPNNHTTTLEIYVIDSKAIPIYS